MLEQLKKIMKDLKLINESSLCNIFFYKKRYLTIDRQYFPREGQVRAVRIHAAGIRQVVIQAGGGKADKCYGPFSRSV